MSRRHIGDVGARLGWDRDAAVAGSTARDDDPQRAPRGRLNAPRPQRPRAAAPEQAIAPELPRHCWLVDHPDAPGRWPALLLAWRRTDHGWQGQAVAAVPTADGPVTLVRWVAAEHLRPS